MLAAGLDVHLSNCYKLERLRQARGQVHTNKKDADLLSLLPLEAARWWEVWRAPRDVRDLRELTRYWITLKAMDVEAKNRLHALCHRHGIFYDFKDLFGGRGRAFLAEVARNGLFPDGQLDEGALFHWRGQVKLIEHLREQLADLTRELRKRLTRSALASRLDGIPGVGLILAHVLMAEIGDINRFAGHGRLASYSLLAPRAHDTGLADPIRTTIGRRLGKKGNHVLKWAMIVAARGAVRKGGKWRNIFDHYTAGGRNSRNRGYIKVARELVKVVDVVWRKNVAYSDTPPARSGCGRDRPRRDRASRSGTGQLSNVMAYARQ
jgi:transposase